MDKNISNCLLGQKSSLDKSLLGELSLGQKSSLDKSLLGQLSLGQKSLGQLSPWTIAPWTIVAVPGSPTGYNLTMSDLSPVLGDAGLT